MEVKGTEDPYEEHVGEDSHRVDPEEPEAEEEGEGEGDDGENDSPMTEDEYKSERMIVLHFNPAKELLAAGLPWTLHSKEKCYRAKHVNINSSMAMQTGEWIYDNPPCLCGISRHHLVFHGVIDWEDEVEGTAIINCSEEQMKKIRSVNVDHLERQNKKYLRQLRELRGKHQLSTKELRDANSTIAKMTKTQRDKQKELDEAKNNYKETKQDLKEAKDRKERAEKDKARMKKQLEEIVEQQKEYMLTAEEKEELAKQKKQEVAKLRRSLSQANSLNKKFRKQLSKAEKNSRSVLLMYIIVPMILRAYEKFRKGGRPVVHRRQTIQGTTQHDLPTKASVIRESVSLGSTQEREEAKENLQKDAGLDGNNMFNFHGNPKPPQVKVSLGSDSRNGDMNRDVSDASYLAHQHRMLQQTNQQKQDELSMVREELSRNISHQVARPSGGAVMAPLREVEEGYHGAYQRNAAMGYGGNTGYGQSSTRGPMPIGGGMGGHRANQYSQPQPPAKTTVSASLPGGGYAPSSRTMGSRAPIKILNLGLGDALGPVLGGHVPNQGGQQQMRRHSLQQGGGFGGAGMQPAYQSQSRPNSGGRTRPQPVRF